MFKNIAQLVAQAQSENKTLGQIMLEQEAQESGRPLSQLRADMAARLAVMRSAVQQGVQGVVSHSGMTGGDAKLLYAYLEQGCRLTSPSYLRAICYAVATNEVNAAMGVVCATPTAGSSGVVPGVLLALQESLHLSEEAVVEALFAAGAVGYIIANNAFVSGAAGGCQAEIGSASAMAAAAAVQLAGGTPHQAAHAMAIALKNMLGLSCDPVAGLVEVPCIKRNAAGASNALAAAEMALAGVESRIPWDEVIAAMHQIGASLPESLRETALGGLAVTETGKRWKARLMSN